MALTLRSHYFQNGLRIAGDLIGSLVRSSMSIWACCLWLWRSGAGANTLPPSMLSIRQSLVAVPCWFSLPLYFKAADVGSSRIEQDSPRLDQSPVVFPFRTHYGSFGDLFWAVRAESFDQRLTDRDPGSLCLSVSSADLLYTFSASYRSKLLTLRPAYKWCSRNVSCRIDNAHHRCPADYYTSNCSPLSFYWPPAALTPLLSSALSFQILQTKKHTHTTIWQHWMEMQILNETNISITKKKF